MAGRLATMAGQLAYVKLYSNLLPHAELGIYFFLLSLSNGFFALAYYPLDQYQQTHLYEYRRQGISLRSFLPANVKLLGVLLAGIAIALPVWYAIDGKVHYELLLCLLLAEATHIVNSIRNFLNNLEHKALAAGFFAADAIARPITLIVLSVFVVVTPAKVLAMALLSMIVVAIAIVPLARRSGIFAGRTVSPPSIRNMLFFASPIAAAAVLGWLQLQGFRFLTLFGFSDTIGVYATVAGIGGSAVLATSPILVQMYQPDLFKTNGAFTPRYLLYTLGWSIAVAVVVAIFAIPVTRLLTNASFVPYAYASLFGVCVEGCTLVLGGLVCYFNLRKRTDVFFVSSCLALVICAGLVAVLIALRMVSPYTIGATLCISQAVSLGYAYFVFLRMFGAESKTNDAKVLAQS
ncbi:MAG: hypothetical protein WDM81_19240 [Rhizomicrobium sp.]